jgi:hypothetical protein
VFFTLSHINVGFNIEWNAPIATGNLPATGEIGAAVVE